MKDGIVSALIIILGSTFLFFEGLAEILNQKTPIMIGYFELAMDSLNKAGFGLIIIGFSNFIIMTEFSKIFEIKNIESEIEKFRGNY